MYELMQAALSPFNIVYTIMLVIAILYWLSVIIGVLDIGAFDFDIEMDTDFDTDIDISAGNGLTAALHFFNIGRLPFMVIFTIISLILWTLSILGNYYMGQGSWIFPLVMFLPMLLIALVLTKFITAPLIPVFERLNEGQAAVDFIGLTGRVVLPADNKTMGQAKIIHENNHLLVTIKLTENSENVVERGEEVLIIGESPLKKYYYVEPLS